METVIKKFEKHRMPQTLGDIGNIKPEFVDKSVVILELQKKLRYEQIKEDIRREKVKMARYGSDLQLLTLLSKDCNALIRHRVAMNKNTPEDILSEIASTDISGSVRLAALKRLKKRS